MNKQFESTFWGADNTELFYHLWGCPEPKGNIILTHGLAEHSETYEDLALKLNKLKWNVFAWDLRGHGRSEGKRGYVENFDDLSSDLELFVKEIDEKHNPDHLPNVFFGHSLGGLITLKTLMTKPIEAAAVTLSAPELGLALKVPPLKIRAAQLGAKWLPKLTLWNEIRYKDLTRDEDFIKKYPKDPLRHDKISPRLFLGMIDAFEYVQQHAADFNFPLLLQVAGSDPIVSPQAQIDFFEKVPTTNKEMHIYEDSLHEIYNDLDKDDAFKDLSHFLNRIKTNGNPRTQKN